MNIKSILTKEEKEFIKHHGISLSEIYDARGKIAKVYHDEAKAMGCKYVINSCIYGHRLKTRSGHCIQCRPANIAFQKRYSKPGILYLAVIEGVCKVGITENNDNDPSNSIYRREITLNMDGGYGNLEGWKIVNYWEVINAGRIENEVHTHLAKYKMEDIDYWYSGEWRVADELFKCSQTTALKAVKKVLNNYLL